MMNQEAVMYLMNSSPSLWVRSAFPVPRYGNVTSNSTESLKLLLEPLRSGLHLNALVKWVSKVTNLFIKREQEHMNEGGEITEKINSNY
jgi:hypothetical protein